MTTTRTPLQRKIYGHEAPHPQMILPEGVPLPKPVSAANARARSLVDAYIAAGNELAEAEKRAKRAPHDREAAVRLDAARGARRETKEAAISAVFESRDVMVEHYGQLSADGQKRLAVLSERANELIGELRTTIDAALFERTLAEALERVGATIDTMDFRMPQPDSPRAKRRRERMDRMECERPAAPGDSRLNVPRDLDHLIPALAVKVEQEFGGSQ
jgi:hypothetical protein